MTASPVQQAVSLSEVPDTIRAGTSDLTEAGLRPEERLMANAKVQVRRAYEDPAEDDGTRVLAGRIWPRGLTKARAALDEWCKEIAPSTGCVSGMATIRSASGNSAAATRRNWQSLNGPARLAHLRELASGRGVTLLTATRRPEISEAAVLARLLRN